MNGKSLVNLIIFTIVTGACGIVAQTLLLREMLIIFSGNELSIGVIIGSWILWEALGAYLGGKKNLKRASYINILVLLTVLFSFLFPISIYLTRVFKVIAGIPLDTGAGILHIFCASFLILFPTGFLHGMLFTYTCSFFSESLRDDKLSIGKVYFFEMLGTIIGGFLLNYFLIQFFNAFSIAVSLSAVSFFSCLLLLFSFEKALKKGFLIMIIMFLFSAFIILFTGGTKAAHDYSLKKQWSGRNIVYYKNSLYQNIVVIKEQEQFSFFADGIPVLTIPTPDIAYIEDVVHLTMLSHKNPEEVLILGKGAGGFINEILKYSSVKKIDYVETDPQFLETIQLFSSETVEKELKNPIVKLHFRDGRLFLMKSQNIYDVIFINVSLPYTLQNNRFFTEEFFKNVKKSLKRNGIALLTLPGSMSYYTYELKKLHRCILKTVSSVFSYTEIIPGDYNLFIFSESKDPINAEPETMLKRYYERKIETKLINSVYLEDRLDKKKKDWYLAHLSDVSTDINRDFLPSGFLYTLAYNNLLYSPYLKYFFEQIKYIDFIKMLIGVLILSFLFFIVSFRSKGVPVIYAIGTTGLTSIVLELILMFAFQIHFGYVFFEVGILVTVFLCGIALGGITALAPFVKRVKDIKTFCAVESALIIFSCVIFFILKYGESGLNSYPFLNKAMFFILLFFVGLCTGIEFPIGSRLYGENSKRVKTVGNVVGVLYSVDLIGGCIGGFFGGILLSAVGILQGCVILVVLKISSLLLLLKMRS